jgi:4-aminobutyrate aminotransferase
MKKQFKSEGDINISALRQKWQQTHLNAATYNLLARDEKYFLKQSLSTPCLNGMRDCYGIYIEDLEGRKYMDFHGNNVHQVGFANPAVIAAMKKQLDGLSFCTRRYTNEIAVALAQKLTELAPADLNKVLFCPGGAEAVGIALKLARVATGRHKTISMWDAFHGATLDTISVGGEAEFRHGIGPLMPGTEHAPSPDASLAFYNLNDPMEWEMLCARYVEYMLGQEGDIAAVIAEPVRSTPYVPSKMYWQIIRRACDNYGTLLIFDEIPHALGRTGKMFTCENFGVTPGYSLYRQRVGRRHHAPGRSCRPRCAGCGP